MYPEEFQRMYLRRGARTPADEAVGLRRARRAVSWAVALALLALGASAMSSYLIDAPQVSRLGQLFR